ncbi:PadR family transcriptional regulator [Desertibaculum subflavum]|uniref:PadR family transcriptional regulator n=1 Tax=Desertibaculum subflavum TaxID=2268458 RepID=UPI000E6709EC
MALAEAILVCLTEQPMTGYELTKAFDSTVGFFWRTGHQQIYRELQRLKTEGAVDAREVVQNGKPNKLVYTLTPAGRDRLRQWSTIPTERPSARDDMLLKLYALDSVDKDALRQEILMRLDHHRARLDLYERIFGRRYAGKETTTRETGRLMGLKFGMMMERGLIAWCEEALGMLDQLDRTV